MARVLKGSHSVWFC